MLPESGFVILIYQIAIQNLIRIAITHILEVIINGQLMSQNVAKHQIRAPTPQPPQHQTIGSPTTALLQRPLLVK